MFKRNICIIIGLFFVAFQAPADSATPGNQPKSAFAVAPHKAGPILDRLEKSSGRKVVLTKSEDDLFTDAADGKLDKHSFAESCLIASGVTDPVERQKYIQKLAALEAEARKAIGSAKSPQEKAERLLQFLHDGAMAGGYEEAQTLLHVILDKRTFNCVSSAAIYNILGCKLGLELHAVEIPGHVFSILTVDNQEIHIETTNKLGFNPKRDPETLKKLEKPGGGDVFDPVKHADQRRDVRELGLAAIIAYNQGVQLSDEKKRHEAIVANFRALRLDPGNPSAVNNAKAGFTNWGNDLMEEKKFEAALNVIETGLLFMPKDENLQNNYKVCWHQYAEERMSAGKDDEALTVARRAAKALPGPDFVTFEAELFVRKSQELADAKRWDDALALAERGLGKVSKDAQEKLRDWRNGIFLNWSNTLTEEKQYTQALAILKRATGVDPRDERFAGNARAVYDAWADESMQKKDWAGAIKIYKQGLAQFPGDSHLMNNLRFCEQEQKRTAE